MNKKKKIRVFDFFSGCGGTSMGLKLAGMDIVLAIDTDKEALNTFEHNISPLKTINRDIRKIDTKEVDDIVALYKKDNYILFCGCAPCQPFSMQNKKRFKSDDDRIDLLSEFLKFVKKSKPDFILCENVPGIQKIGDKGPLPNFINTLRKMGYHVPEPKIIHAQKYGIPQTRRRLVLIASKLGDISYPEETHGKNKLPYETVKNAIDYLPEIKAGEEYPDKENFPNHRCAALNKINLERIQCITEGQGRSDWPERLKLKCHATHNGHTDVYGRLTWDAPSVTLTTKCTNISNGRFGHPSQDRALSIREAACLQTFPRNFVFMGNSLGEMAKQVGNAVPVELAKIIGQQFINQTELHNKGELNG